MHHQCDAENSEDICDAATVGGVLSVDRQLRTDFARRFLINEVLMQDMLGAFLQHAGLDYIQITAEREHAEYSGEAGDEDEDDLDTGNPYFWHGIEDGLIAAASVLVAHRVAARPAPSGDEIETASKDFVFCSFTEGEDAGLLRALMSLYRARGGEVP